MTKRRKQPPEDREGKVIAYARVSTEEQNIDMQTAALEKYGYDALFQENWFVYAEEEEVEHNCAQKKYRAVFCAVDPSMGKTSRRHDPSALIIGGVLADGTIDVLEADIEKRHPDQLLEDIFTWHKKYDFRLVGIEEVQFQELFKDQVEKEGKKRMKQLGNVEVPQEAFLAVLKVDN